MRIAWINFIKKQATQTGLLKQSSMGITRRTALLSWMVTIATLLLFVVAIIPEQEHTYLQSLESKANSLAVSLHDITAGAAINEDYSSVVDHCTEIIMGDSSIEYVVITKNDGFSIINDRKGWRSETNAAKEWHPENSPKAGIKVSALVDKTVFQYSQPFIYSSLRWGWIHVGLSLDGYHQSVRMIYRRTLILTVFCILLSLLASVIYARHLVRPILSLRTVVQQVTSGNLSSRAAIDRSDELGSLARSVNLMTEALLRRDQILQSVRFAAQQFLNSPEWKGVIAEVLSRIGETAALGRIHVFENERDQQGDIRSALRFEWLATGISSAMQTTRQNFSWRDADLKSFTAIMEQGETFHTNIKDLPELHQIIFTPYGVKSLMVAPITVDGEWWGVLCLEDCHAERLWTQAEQDSTRATAELLGAAITRQKTQDSLKAAKEAAEAASQAKSQFLANMSHEIRTPINGVLGMLRLLQRTELDKRQTRFTTAGLISAQSLLKVIGDILDFSKIEAGKMELEEHPFSAAGIMDTVIRLFAESAERKGIELAYRMDANVPPLLLGDSNRLRQILVNLIGNSIKFTDKGEIVATCHMQESTENAITLRFSVRDTGCGIAPEKQSLVFEGFAQADSSMARNYGGTGLGLTISRQLCRLMGGNLVVQSQLGSGSNFTFTVQLKRPSTGHAMPLSKSLDLRNLRVLVVDDSAITREICSEFIASWQGLEETAADGTQALEIMRAAVKKGHPYQVAILDWKMPGIDGLALARLIKADPELKDTGLVLLSSFTNANDQEAISDAGFATSIPKPTSKSDLYDAIVTAANGSLSLDPLQTRPAHTPLTGVKKLQGTVLLAEDNEINREVATEMLSEIGCSFQCAHNGKEAVEAWKKGGISLILMDCQMPEMDGYEAAGLIRREETLQSAPKHIPIVALTAHAAKGDRDRCLAAGMDDYLTKPMDLDCLAQMLKKWIPEESPVALPTPLSPAPHSAEPIDYPSLLHRCMGKPELASRLIKKLAEQASVDLAEIDTALKQNDAAALSAAAHRLKGSSSNVSAEGLRQTASLLEKMGRENNLSAAAEAASQLQMELTRLKAYLAHNEKDVL